MIDYRILDSYTRGGEVFSSGGIITLTTTGSFKLSNPTNSGVNLKLELCEITATGAVGFSFVFGGTSTNSQTTITDALPGSVATSKATVQVGTSLITSGNAHSGVYLSQSGYPLLISDPFFITPGNSIGMNSIYAPASASVGIVLKWIELSST